MAKDLNAQQTGLQRNNPVNENTPQPIRGLNKFPDTFSHPDTHRFGDIDPFFVKNVLRHDTMPFQAGHELRTHTLASPMLSGVEMEKTLIHVPMRAIYPLNWDLMLVPPTQGDDVPDDTRLVVRNLLSFCNSLLTYLRSDVFKNMLNTTRWPQLFVYLFFLESVFSEGSLFAKMNMHFSTYFSWFPNQFGSRSFDEFFDSLIGAFIENNAFDNVVFRVKYESGNEENFAVSLTVPDVGFNGRIVSVGALLELLRDNEFSVLTFADQPLGDFAFVGDIVDKTQIIVPKESNNVTNVAFNIEYIAAYQLACSQFATNEHVDFIYSADLYRKELRSQFASYINFFDTQTLTALPLVVEYFQYNGDSYEYDVFSGRYFDELFSDLSTITQVPLEFTPFLGFLNIHYTIVQQLRINVFSARKSLKYGDYFTGARPQPLAVGEVSVPLQNGQVDILDTTRGISITRFRNTVNIAGRKVGNYLKALWGGVLPKGPDDIPTFLVSERFGIGKQEVENTGAEQASPDAQNIVTTNLRSGNSKFLINASFDEPAIVIGLVSFDARTIYSKTMTRFAFHYDRYDDFIPQMQYFGDQEIFARELGLNSNENFAYTIRNMEYKQSYPYASGGFINYLKSWVMLQDNSVGNPLPPNGKISPEFIRFTNYEFDRFYKSLTGYSLASRFHFIVNHRNICSMTRQMAYTPQILQ